MIGGGCEFSQTSHLDAHSRQVVVVRGEQFVIDGDDGQLGVGIVLNDVQALEAGDARERDVCLARAERFCRRVHEVVHGSPLRFVDGSGAREHEGELPALESLVVDHDCGSNGKHRYDVPAEVLVTGMSIGVTAHGLTPPTVNETAKRRNDEHTVV